ncbi:hypothetical protein ACHWQZ_G012635 [Mnemiopsis leidyi]
MEQVSEVGGGSGELSGGGEPADPPNLSSGESGEEEPEESETYRIISVEDSPEVFPFLVEQFYRLKEQFPSINCGSVYLDIHVFSITLEERLLVMVRCNDLKVVAGISFGLLPKTSSLYVSYMITDEMYRGHGFMKELFQEMKHYVTGLFPEAYSGGFSGIFADTLAQPLSEYNDYFSKWENIMTTHEALNRMGFYQLAFNFVMFGEIEEDGLQSKGSTDFVMLIHKDSTAISKSEHPNFQLAVDSWWPEAVMYQFSRMAMSTWYPENLGEEFANSLFSIPKGECFVRRQLPFYRTDKLYPDHLK